MSGKGGNLEDILKKSSVTLFIFDCTGSSLLHKLFSGCGEQGLLFMRCTIFSLWWLLLVQSTGSRVYVLQNCGTWAQQLQLPGSIVVEYGFSCSMACGIFPDHGSNFCLLHWQSDSLPLNHQGSPRRLLLPQIYLQYLNC